MVPDWRRYISVIFRPRLWASVNKVVNSIVVRTMARMATRFRRRFVLKLRRDNVFNMDDCGALPPWAAACSESLRLRIRPEAFFV